MFHWINISINAVEMAIQTGPLLKKDGSSIREKDMRIETQQVTRSAHTPAAKLLLDSFINCVNPLFMI